MYEMSCVLSLWYVSIFKYLHLFDGKSHSFLFIRQTTGTRAEECKRATLVNQSGKDTAHGAKQGRHYNICERK